MIHRIIKALTNFDIASKGVGTHEIADDLPVVKLLRTEAPFGAGVVVSISATGGIVDADQATSSKMPAVAVISNPAVSGALIACIKDGPFHASGYNFSGYVGRSLYIGASGAFSYAVIASGQFQQVGTVLDGSGIIVSIGSLQQKT